MKSCYKAGLIRVITLPDAEAAGMTFKPLPQLLADSEVVFTCLNKNVLLPVFTAGL